MNQETLAMLTEKAKLVRRGIIESTHAAGCGHPGGSLSIADIVTYLYFKEMHIDEKIPKWRSATGLCFPKDTLRPHYTRRSHTGVFSRRRI